MAKPKDAHHGGAWKVAFADFMTAMMALFLVLWISAQDQEILIAASQYFQSPFNSPLDNTSGVLPFESNSSPKGQDDSNGKAAANTNTTIDIHAMQALAREFYRLLDVSENDPNAPMRVDVSSDGLKVTLFDGATHPLFVKDSIEFTEWGRLEIQNLAWMIDRQKFRVVVEAHSRAGIVSSIEGYTEWDLSSDQANATRKALAFYAVESSHFERVSGFGAMHPLPGEPADSPRNQRIVLSLSLASRPSDAREAAGGSRPEGDAAPRTGTETEP